MHEAETSVIPLGVRDGFGKQFDFREIQERLVRGWVGQELAVLAENPERSPIYRNVIIEIAETGYRKWRSMDHQLLQTRKGLTQPG